MKRAFSIAAWILVAVLGAGSLAKIAVHRGEPINAMWFVAAALGCYALAFRFYSAFVAARLLTLRRHARHARRARRRRPRFCPHQQVGAIRPSFRSHRRSRAAGRSRRSPRNSVICRERYG